MRIATAEIVFVRPVMEFWHTNRVALTTGGAPFARRIMQRVPSARRMPGIATNVTDRTPRPRVARITGIVPNIRRIIQPPMHRIAITPGTVRATRRRIRLTKVAKTVGGTAKKKVVGVCIIRWNKRPVRIRGTALDIDTVI